jgi:hypothetical protein
VITICPTSHDPRVYGECPDCLEWFVVRRNGRLRTHKDCKSRSLYNDAPEPTQLALMCVADRWEIEWNT